jgi:hypothetical protein
MRTSGGRVLLQRPVRPVRVVVIDVFIKDQPQVPFADDEHPVQALAPGASDPAFGDGVRLGRHDRALDNPPAQRAERRVERLSELGVAVLRTTAKTRSAP